MRPQVPQGGSLDAEMAPCQRFARACPHAFSEHCWSHPFLRFPGARLYLFRRYACTMMCDTCLCTKWPQNVDANSKENLLRRWSWKLWVEIAPDPQAVRTVCCRTAPWMTTVQHGNRFGAGSRLLSLLGWREAVRMNTYLTMKSCCLWLPSCPDLLLLAGGGLV